MDIVIVLLVAVPIFINLHEFGHFLVARWCGVPVERMRFGVGPAWHSWKDRHGTEFCLGIFPAAFSEIDDKVWDAAPPLQRMLVASGGPAMNLFCALVLLLFAYSFQQSPTAVVGATDVDGAAYQAGLRDGDRIVAVDGRETETWTDVGLHIVSRVGDTGNLTLEVIGAEAGSESRRLEMSISDWQGDAFRIDMFEAFGITASSPAEAAGNVFTRIGAGLVDTWRIIWSTAAAGFQMIFGEMRIVNFLGGLQLSQLGLDASDLGWSDYLKIAALFSIGFGIINSLPGPVVDGRAILTGAVEWLRGKLLPPVAHKVSLYVGSVLGFGPLVICLTWEMLRVWG